MNIYYVYAYLREDNTPYYIGKGKENRAYVKQRSTHRPKDKNKIIFLKTNLSEEEAYYYEEIYIKQYGRKDLGTGILYNKTDGGDGGKGHIVTEETKRKISIGNTGNKRPDLSERNKKGMHTESIEKMVKTRHANGSYDSENNPMFGKKHSEEAKYKMSINRKGKYRYPKSEETKRKMSEARKKYWELKRRGN